ncbi:MAG: MerR family transcriptional regulator [Acidimicrobiia bacterium]
MSDPELLSIGEVINLLRDDFPDVSVSKIRFLESQGLIDPRRSPSGYRQFDQHDIARLRFILRQQRDHFLPLKVIKSKLTVWERGEDEGQEALEARSGLDSHPEPLTEADILKRSNLTRDQLQELIEAGLIQPVPDTDVFPPEARIIASEARRLFDHGLEPRHLRAIRLAADREADLLKQLVAPLLKARNAEAQAAAREVLESCIGSVQAMHRALLSTQLRQRPAP